MGRVFYIKGITFTKVLNQREDITFLKLAVDVTRYQNMDWKRKSEIHSGFG